MHMNTERRKSDPTVHRKSLLPPEDADLTSRMPLGPVADTSFQFTAASLLPSSDNDGGTATTSPLAAPIVSAPTPVIWTLNSSQVDPSPAVASGSESGSLGGDDDYGEVRNENHMDLSDEWGSEFESEEEEEDVQDVVAIDTDRCWHSSP